MVSRTGQTPACITGSGCFPEGWSFRNFHIAPLADSGGWDYSMRTCTQCGQLYLHAYSETMGFAGSSRWIWGALDPATPLADDPRLLIGLLRRCPRLFYGGRHWAIPNGRWIEKDPLAIPYAALDTDC